MLATPSSVAAEPRAGLPPATRAAQEDSSVSRTYFAVPRARASAPFRQAGLFLEVTPHATRTPSSLRRPTDFPQHDALRAQDIRSKPLVYPDSDTSNHSVRSRRADNNY